jgi:DNA-directed RNA polymerase subunit H (RpoH/RPB5)
MLKKVYLNSLYMMMHRGYEEADAMIHEVEKTKDSTMISGKEYQDLGYSFSDKVKSDIKDFENRFLMSYCLKSEVKNEKQFVIFGNDSRAFISVLSDIIIDDENDNDNTNIVYNIIVPKEFKGKNIKDRIDIIAKKVHIFTFTDMEMTKPPFHAYGSRYELMTKKEVEDLLKSIMITTKQMRKISSQDPMIKYYGFFQDNCVRVHRTPMITGALVKHRIDYLFIS